MPTVKASFVYILPHIKGDRFKIGKARDVLVRARAFGVADINFARSWALALKTDAEACSLERTLHRTFQRWRLPADRVLELGGSAVGSTEWYSIECEERIRTYLEQNQDLFNFTFATISALPAAQTMVLSPLWPAMFGSPLKARLIHWLYVSAPPDQYFTERNLARQAQVPEGAVHRPLLALVASDFIVRHFTEDGPSYRAPHEDLRFEGLFHFLRHDAAGLGGSSLA
jgi:hypothetical protein